MTKKMNGKNSKLIEQLNKNTSLKVFKRYINLWSSTGSVWPTFYKTLRNRCGVGIVLLRAQQEFVNLSRRPLLGAMLFRKHVGHLMTLSSPNQ